jgi:hypothetical protein
MEYLVDLARDHYQWLFSGIGVVAIGAVITLFRSRRTQREPKVVSRGNDNVISVNQSGGVTAGTYVNQAPKPQLKQISSQRARNTDGTYTASSLVEVVSPYPPANLYIQANAEDILDLECISQRPGVRMTGHSGKRPGYCFTNLVSPSGKYMIKVRTQGQTPVDLLCEFGG